MVLKICDFASQKDFFVSNFSLTGGFCDDAVPLMWPGGASAVSVAAELLAGPMWGGREGGARLPERAAWKKTDQVKTTTQRYYPTDQHAEPLNMQPLFFFSLDGLPGAALGPRAGWAGSRG